MSSDGGAARSRSRPVVLITGASAGLGAALARELVRREKATGAGADGPSRRSAGRAGRELTRHCRPDLEILTIAADLADPATPSAWSPRRFDRSGGSTC